MLLAKIVETSARVGRTSSRLAKVDVLAACLREAESDEVGIAVTWLSGSVRQPGLASVGRRSTGFAGHPNQQRSRC